MFIPAKADKWGLTAILLFIVILSTCVSAQMSFQGSPLINAILITVEYSFLRTFFFIARSMVRSFRIFIENFLKSFLCEDFPAIKHPVNKLIVFSTNLIYWEVCSNHFFHYIKEFYFYDDVIFHWDISHFLWKSHRNNYCLRSENWIWSLKNPRLFEPELGSSGLRSKKKFKDLLL